MRAQIATHQTPSTCANKRGDTKGEFIECVVSCIHGWHCAAIAHRLVYLLPSFAQSEEAD